jgi:hypothetical protein
MLRRSFVGAVLGTLLTLLSQAQVALADYSYLGTGQWTTSTLYYYSYAAGDYQTATNGAGSDWDQLTDLTVQATAEGFEKIGAFAGNWGETSWDARVIISTTSGTCYSSGSINENYNYAEIDYNTHWMDSYSLSVKRAVAAHEFGHTFSLGHVFTCDPDHLMFTPVQHSCNGGITAPQQHDIDGVNVRY